MSERRRIPAVHTRVRRTCILTLALALILAGTIASASESLVAAAENKLTVRDLAFGDEAHPAHLWLVLFSEHDYAFEVIDNATPAGETRFKNVATAMAATGCVAGCNGSFFNRSPFEPCALMIADGRTTGPFDPASWYKGMLVVRDRGPSLEPSETWKPQPEVRHLIQSGPWLVRAGKIPPDMDPHRVARRTFICRGPDGRWAMGAADYCSLQQLSTVLTGSRVHAEMDVIDALNFDGGPSTSLWVKQGTGALYIREGWPVRNYIGLRARSEAGATK